MASNGISVTELTSQPASQKQWRQLTSGQISDPQEIVEAETFLTRAIFTTEAEKKINSLTNQVQQVLKLKQTIQIAQLKKELLKFIAVSDTYYAPKKPLAQALLTKLENYSVPQSNSPTQNSSKLSLPTKILLGTGVSLAILVLSVILVRLVQKKGFRRKNS